MAAMVVRSSDDKVLLSGLGHSHFQPDKVSRIRNEDAAPQCGRSRSRKAKNGPKKQPQRGLGVAQLEKLRLQEQSKQDAACLASLGLVPLSSTYAFPTDQGPSVCLPHHLLSRHIKGGTFQMNTASVLSLGGNSYRSPTDRNGGFQGADPVWGKDGESSAPHSAVPDPSLSILLSQQQESAVAAAAFHGSRIAAEVSKAAVSHVVPLLSSGMERHPVHPDKNAGGLMAAIRASSRAEVEMIKQDIKAHKTGDVGGHHFGVNCVQMFDASLPPGPLPQRDCRELSMVGIPKELSSFQTKFPGNQVWPTMHNASAQKRPCVVLQENPRVLIPLDHGEIHSNSVQSETADNILKGAHYTPRSISTALGKSSLPFLKTDAGAKSNISGFDNVKCKTDPNDSMSSVSSMPFLQRKRASPTYLDSPSPKKAAGADFLSLSLSIPHTDVESKDSNQISSKSDSSHLQRSLSLQETVTDVEDCSQKSPSSYGNSNSVEISMSGSEVENISKPPPPPVPVATRASSPWQQQMRSFNGHMTLPSKCGIQQVPNKCSPPEVDLSLKL